jgi:hypothetical protein
VQALQDNGEILRAELTAQKKQGVDRTGVTLNLVKYKQVLKGTPATGNGHQEELRKELIFRKVPELEVDALIQNELWWSEVLGKLMDLEIKRIRDLEGTSAADLEMAKKYFRPMSGAKFEPLEASAKDAGTKRKATLKPLELEQPKKKKGSGRNRY